MINLRDSHKERSKAPTVIIVEDSPSIQFIYKKMFDLIGFRIITIASNGQEAIEVIKALPLKPDFIILDYLMPIKNGLEVLEEIKDSIQYTKIIMTSADTSIKQEALNIGAYKFLNKTFRLDVIKEIHNEFMNQ